MIRRFDNDFMCPNANHAVEHTLGLAIQSAFDAQRRKLIGHDTHGPSRGIALWRRPAIGIRPVRLDLRRRLALISIAKRAESPLDLHVLAYKIGWALRSVRGNYHPTANNRVFSQLRHCTRSFPWKLGKPHILRRQGGVPKQFDQRAGLAVIVYADDIEPPLARWWKPPQILARHLRHLAPLVIIDCRLGGLHVTSGSGLNLHKAKYIAIPTDQVNFSAAAWSPVIARDDHVSQLPQVEIGILFPAHSRAQMSRPLVSWKHTDSKSVEAPDYSTRKKGGKHENDCRLRSPQPTGCDETHRTEYF